jgi:hypothetical protein
MRRSCPLAPAGANIDDAVAHRECGSSWLFVALIIFSDDPAL